MIIAKAEHRTKYPILKSLNPAAKRARKHFLAYYPDGFRDASYLKLERGYGFPFHYRSHPDWETYSEALAFAETVRRDQGDLKPKDMLDLQGFIWVLGSDEYPQE